MSFDTFKLMSFDKKETKLDQIRSTLNFNKLAMNVKMIFIHANAVQFYDSKLLFFKVQHHNEENTPSFSIYLSWYKIVNRYGHVIYIH